MNARRAARELALMVFSQIKMEKCENKEIEDIVLSSIRTLLNDAEQELKITVGALLDAKEYIEKIETEHPTNLERPIDMSNVPVQIPMTSDMTGRIDSLINVADKSFHALEIAEIAALANKKDVKKHVSEIIQKYCEHKIEINDMINKHSKGWNISRLVKIDKNILIIATTEMLYFEDIPTGVSIDEAVELAKKYSAEESSSFINGILGQIAKEQAE